MRITADAPVRGQRPAVTTLFESAAEHFGAAAAGIVLTGMGEDGAPGVRALLEAGAPVLAEDETSAIVYGMPAAAVREGATPMPLTQLAGRPARLVLRREEPGMTESASILLVEDSNTQALQMRILLEREGFKVARAASAEAALEMMAEARPDLLLVDYHLPGMNGDELVRQVRLNLRTRALPILMLTGGPTRERELQGLDSGASAYVTKSSDPALLIGQLRALLRQRGASSESSAPVGFQRGALMLIASDPACRRAFEPLLEAEGYRALFADDAATRRSWNWRRDPSTACSSTSASAAKMLCVRWPTSPPSARAPGRSR